MKKNYLIEREGQIDFFNNYHIPYDGDASVLIDYTDGVYHGNILEFKLNINNTGKVLFQAIKYLSKMRIKGESVPARILLIDLNSTKVYVYNSEDYLNDIQKVYIGSASIGNNAFNSNVAPIAEYNYMDMVGSAKVLELLINKDKNKWYIPIDLDENCIVGWAERYYREVPIATKGDFLGDGTGKINTNGEIRDPRHFKGLINPYTEQTNEKFKYLMDCLNDRPNKKDLGAFYTPTAYCEKASELVLEAVNRVPDGNDYIILDRCAGTGNLEASLVGKYDKNGDELISHCIVSTYEYYEYKVLSERLGDKVRNIIPPTEANVIYENGKISNADAMSKDFVENPLIKQYIDNEKCSIILFENPPYRDISSNSNGRATKQNNNYVVVEMKKEIRGNATNDMANWFIWSGFKYYLRQKSDSYIVFSPIKYWKTHHLVNKAMREGFLFNREFFHATLSSISCILWENKDKEQEKIILKSFDIKDNKLCLINDFVEIQKATNTPSKLFDKRKNDDYIGVMNVSGFNLDAMSRGLLRINSVKGHGSCSNLYKDTYISKLPLWVAKNIPLDEWYEKDIYATTSDGGDEYTKDNNFLNSCLIYTCLSNQNKCLTFTGSDGKFYKNELCFDNTNGKTVASFDLEKIKLDNEEKELISLWNNILEESKRTNNYNSKLTYGVYQIIKELNTFHKEGVGKNQRIIYDYPILNGYLETLRIKLKEYYKSHITDKMFKYQLIK